MYESLTSVEYAGRRTVTDTMVRHVAYRALQSGCCGYTYGAQGCWNAAWDPCDMRTHWGDLPWHVGIDLPGATQLGHLRRLYESVAWTSLRPDPDAWTTTNVFNTSLYPPLVSSSQDRRTVVAFFSQTFRRDGSQASLVGLAEQPYRLQWFDPRTGHFIRIKDGASPVNGALGVPDPPDGQDWLLVASRSAAS